MVELFLILQMTVREMRSKFEDVSVEKSSLSSCTNLYPPDESKPSGA